MTIGEKILNLRKARGWSQEELADRVGITRQAVSRWEAGTAKPDADKIIAICDLFGISADYLLRDAERKSAAEERDEAELSKPKTGKPLKNIISWCAVGFSAVTLFLLKLLSSLDPKAIVASVIEEVGNGVVGYSPGYSGFAGYIKYYNLEWLVWMAVLVGVGGGAVLLVRWRKKFRA